MTYETEKFEPHWFPQKNANDNSFKGFYVLSENIGSSEIISATGQHTFRIVDETIPRWEKKPTFNHRQTMTSLRRLICLLVSNCRFFFLNHVKA